MLCAGRVASAMAAIATSAMITASLRVKLPINPFILIRFACGSGVLYGGAVCHYLARSVHHRGGIVAQTDNRIRAHPSRLIH